MIILKGLFSARNVLRQRSALSFIPDVIGARISGVNHVAKSEEDEEIEIYLSVLQLGLNIKNSEGKGLNYVCQKTVLEREN